MARLLLLLLLLPLSSLAQCISISDAPRHMGKKTCVAAKVVQVTQSESGAFLLHFCAVGTPCPFAVRVFPIDFGYVGDVRKLVGKEIEINGRIKAWKGQSEIVLRDADQLRGAAANLPPIPKTFDASRRGNAKFGTFTGNKTTKRSMKRPPKEPTEEVDEE